MPGGRPSKIDQRITLADGRTTTVRDRIVELIGIGAYVERAARATGIGKGTLYGWLERAAHSREKLAQNPRHKLVAHDLACIEFSDAVEDAEARYEMTSLAALERIASGTVRLETVTERYEPAQPGGDPVLVERTIKRHGVAPNPHVITWKLVRRFPERYQLAPDAGAAARSGDSPVDLTPAAVAQLSADLDEFARQFD